MSNVRVDNIAENFLRNLREYCGEDAVKRATEHLKDNNLIWWDYWDWEDYGELIRDDAQPVFEEVQRILTGKSVNKMSFTDMVKKQREKNLTKATSTDLKDAEIFGQIVGLLEQVSVKNRKNLGDLLATYPFGHTRPEDIMDVFNKARFIIENDEEQWW